MGDQRGAGLRKNLDRQREACRHSPRIYVKPHRKGVEFAIRNLPAVIIDGISNLVRKHLESSSVSTTPFSENMRIISFSRDEI